MRALVTGASGFIGSHLVDELRRRGWDVRAMVRKTSKLANLEEAGLGLPELAYAGLDNSDAMRTALEEVDAVFHVAGSTSAFGREAYFAANTEGTGRLLEAARSAKGGPKRFVYVSSLMAVGPQEPAVPAREHHGYLEGATFYSEAKLAAEKLCWEVAQTGAMDVVIVRPPLVYGPRDVQVLQIFQAAKMHVVGQASLSRVLTSNVHVLDLVRGTIDAAEKGKALPTDGRPHVLTGDGAARDVLEEPSDEVANDPRGDGIYYLTDHSEVDVTEFGHRAAAALGTWAITIPIPGPFVRLTGVINDVFGKMRGKPPALGADKAKGSLGPAWHCRDDRARVHFGYVPEFGLDAGLAQTMAWYRDKGIL